MTKKKITQVPIESTEGPNVDSQNAFLAEISQLGPSSLHFFDETSVIRTEGNRKYGNSFIGERALEYQKYASNATYTVNLLHSALRVDHYNIIDGPSNGNELLLFFEDVLTKDNPDGSAVLERRDTVVMDNCGFHPITLLIVADPFGYIKCDHITFSTSAYFNFNWLAIDSYCAVNFTFFPGLDKITLITKKSSSSPIGYCGITI